MKFRINSVEFHINPEDVVDLDLEVADLVEYSPDLAKIVVDGSIFDAFIKYSIIYITWEDGPNDNVYAYQMTEQKDNNISMILLEQFNPGSFIDGIKDNIKYSTEIKVDFEDIICDVISEETGFLIDSVNYDIIED